MASITIEKGVPLDARNHLHNARKYPFTEMEVGDSFVAKLADSRATTVIALQNSLLGSARSSIGPNKIATRGLPDRSGVRVWRIA